MTSRSRNGMQPGAVELAAAALERRQKFLIHASALAAISVIVTAVVTSRVPSALVPLSLVTGIEFLVVLAAYYAHRDLIQRLALDPVGEQIPEVHRYCQRLLRQSERDRLAASIDSLIADARIPGTFPIGDRIALFEGELRTLARQLATPQTSVRVRSLITCARLLSGGVESPLFNPDVSVDNLRTVLLQLRHEIGRPEDP